VGHLVADALPEAAELSLSQKTEASFHVSPSTFAFRAAAVPKSPPQTKLKNSEAQSGE
jgi:hypothetical protein